MFYYRSSLKTSHNVTEPDVLEDTYFCWIHYAASFAIIETWEPPAAQPTLTRITGNLAALLESTIAYPPARALAARELEISDLPWPEFASKLEQLLIAHLKDQSTSGFCLLRCLVDQGDSLEMGGYGGAGHFYWALTATDGFVSWVSANDYEVRWSRVEEFELSAQCKLPSEIPGLSGPSGFTLRRLREDAIYSRASFHAGEYAWPIDTLPAILKEAEATGMACVGGTFQFRAEKATAEMYWLTTQTSPRLDGETWSDFCKRAREETMLQVDAIMNTTDFEAEAKSFRAIEDHLRSFGLKAKDCLVFFATFEDK